MKEVVVLSGKGGTGKTSLVACFAVLSSNKVLADCDVDAADLHLLLHPTIKEKNKFRCGQKASLDPQKCASCGTCRIVCRFNAVATSNPPAVNQLLCEGCGFCAHACPEHAIMMQDVIAGYWYVSETPYGPMVHAKLGIAQANSGKLVAQVRERARSLAKEGEFTWLITDGPPGIGCPVISCLSGADLALLVTEPSISGLHDLERVANLCHHFNVQAMVCINKYDLNRENTRLIEILCQKQGLDIAGKIPFDPEMTRAMVNGKNYLEWNHKANAMLIEETWEIITHRLTNSS